MFVAVRALMFNTVSHFFTFYLLPPDCVKKREVQKIDVCQYLSLSVFFNMTHKSYGYTTLSSHKPIMCVHIQQHPLYQLKAAISN